MNHRNIILFSTGTLALAGALFFVVKSGYFFARDIEPREVPVVAVSRQSARPALNNNEELSAELGDTNQKLDALMQNMAKLSKRIDSIESTKEPEEKKHDDIPVKPELTGEEKEQLVQQKLQELETAFSSQERDDIWANGVEASISEVLEKDERASAGQLISSDCRSSTCRVEAVIPKDAGEMAKFNFENALLLGMAKDLQNASIDISTDPDGGTHYVFYLSRSGESNAN